MPELQTQIHQTLDTIEEDSTLTLRIYRKKTPAHFYRQVFFKLVIASLQVRLSLNFHIIQIISLLYPAYIQMKLALHRPGIDPRVVARNLLNRHPMFYD